MHDRQRGIKRHKEITVGIFIALVAVIAAACATTTTSSSSKPQIPATGPGSQYAKILSHAKTLGAGPAADIVPVQSFVAGGKSLLHLTHAKVKITDGSSLLGSSRSGRFGVAIVPMNKPPKQFMVSVSGGDVDGQSFAGVLRAELTSYVAPQTVCVNALTTMIADDLLVHPTATYASATAAVKRLFDLPSWYDVSCDSQSNSYFNGDAVLADIHKVGFQKFIDKAIVLMNDPHKFSTTGFRLLPVVPSTKKAASSAKATATSESPSVDSASTNAAVTAFLTDSSSGTPLDGLIQVFSSLSTISESSEFAFLGPIGAWGGVGLGVYSVVSALAGGSSGPTTADLLSALQTDFTALQSAITNVQSTLNTIENQITSLTSATYETDLASAETVVNPVVTAAHSNMYLLQALDGEAAQIACGDFSSAPNSGNTGAAGTTSTCANGQTIQAVCPASTVLAWNALTGQVAYPPDYKAVLPASASALETNCQDYFIDVFGEGGFVPMMEGNGDLGGNATEGINSESLTLLASDLVHLQGGTSAILQDTSQWVVSQSRFLDTTESAEVQSVYDYYLAVFEEMVLEVATYDGITGEPATNVHNDFGDVPTMAAINAYDPTTVPEGEVVDTETGLVWSQLISANVPCQELAPSSGGANCYAPSSPKGFFGTPSSITPTSLTPASGSQLPSLHQDGSASQNLNADQNAVSLINPLSLSSSNLNGTPAADWYAANTAQLSSLVANLTPTGSQTIGDELQQEPEALNSGAGFDPVIFGGDNQNTGATIGGGVSYPTQSNQYEAIGTNGYCWTETGCYNATVAPGASACTLAGNVNCASPAYVTSNQDIWDLNNAPANNNDGAFSTTISAQNWNQSASFCTDVDGWSGDCYSGSTVSFSDVWSAMNAQGFVTWFYRSPVSSSTGVSECYFYPIADTSLQAGSYAAPGATQGAGACSISPNLNGYNGFWSQALIPASAA